MLSRKEPKSLSHLSLSWTKDEMQKSLSYTTQALSLGRTLLKRASLNLLAVSKHILHAVSFLYALIIVADADEKNSRKKRRPRMEALLFDPICLKTEIPKSLYG
mmetsp:Transcript_50555/g.130312  ORF Transcript_50555/g.130312 Transcript_50555/m.130312 type:complete len:104 (+) Transcript_50555:2226-2537(+)